MVIYHADGERRKGKQGRDWKEKGNELRAKLIWQENGVTNMVIYLADGERRKGKQGRDWKETGN